MALGTARGSREMLRELPTRARPMVNANAVAVPEGYAIEPLVVGLSFPIDLAFSEDGTMYISEGGSTWPTRPAPPPRILSIAPDGTADVFARTIMPGPRGMEVHDGGLYVSFKGGYFSEIHRFDLKTREETIIIDRMPDGGWHEPGGPRFGPDGLMYFGQGSVSLQGVVLPGRLHR